MKRFFLYIIILYSALFVAGCSKSHIEPDTPDVPTPLPVAERTVIVYMAGQNTLATALADDLAEMRRGKAGVPDGVNFIVYTDDDRKPAIYRLTAKDGLQLWKQYDTERCSTDSLTMLETLREIEYYFPARHYGITLWSHASGWAPKQTRSFGQDPTVTTPGRREEMDIPVLAGVLSHLPRFDYIFFDACFMQCIEVAYELRHTTKWMIGSPAEIPGPGAPYDRILPALCSSDINGIIDGYASTYPQSIYSGVLLSCIDCDEMDDMADVTRRLLVPRFMGRASLSFNGFQAYATRLNSFPNFFDMHTTMFHLLSADEYTEWMTAFEKAVPRRYLTSTNRWYADYCDNTVIQDPEHYGGVSMFVPSNSYEYGYTKNWNLAAHQTAWYEACGWEDTGW